MQIAWQGMTGDLEPTTPPSSMHIVDYYNIKAFRELGWDVHVGRAPHLPTISFFHQGWPVMGKPSFHYCCTSSTAVMPKSCMAAERGHDAVFVLNNAMLENYRKVGLRAFFWPHGVDPELQRFVTDDKYDGFTIVNVAQGSFSPKRSIKGISWLVDAVLSLPGVSLLQIGCGWEPNSEIPTSQGNVKISDLPKRIKFLGILPFEDTQQIIAKSHLMVLPSVGEGMPLPVLEAMNLGVPVLCTDLPFTYDFPVSEVIHRIPSQPFVDVEYLHKESFSPRDLADYDIPPTLFRPQGIDVCIEDAIRDIDAWAKECKEYANLLASEASWTAMAKRFAVPIIEGIVH